MVTMNDASPQGTSIRYWLIVLVLVALGFLTIFSFGLYFWFIAVGLILLSPFRSRPKVFRSGFALVVGFLIGYVLLAPWVCGQSLSADPTTGEETVSPIVCTGLIGIEYSGPEPFDPSLTPALIAGGGLALIASAATWKLTP
jgi:apolipoprotein N-acyltransferase